MHEPHVAEDIFREMLKEAGVNGLRAPPAARKDGVRRKALSVREITMENGASFTAKIFLDSSYEGDLMAQSGVSYTWGREGVAQYGRIARRRPRQNAAAPVPGGRVPRMQPTANSLPEISAEKPGPPGLSR